jgi:hypothetical protein
MRKLWIAVGVLVAPLVLADLAADAQSLNSRQTAPPGMKAKIGNALTSSRVKQAEQGDVQLRKKSVHDDCGPVSIGNSEAESNRRRGMAGREETVIVPETVVTICR